MGKGKRFDEEGKLNYKKVAAVIIAIVVVIMFVFVVKSLVSKKDNKNNMTENVDYYALYADNKWGIINSLGEVVIEPMYQEMIIVLNNSKDVFLCTYDVNEETGEYKTKLINKKNNEIYKGYDKIEVLENYDTSGNAWYEEDIFKVQKNGKYGLIDIDGKEVLSIQYDNIQTLKGAENSLLVEKDGKKGIVNKSGVTVVEPQYKTISIRDNDYRNGYITIDDNDKYGLKNYTGNEILENKYEKIKVISGEDYFVIQEDGKEKLINTEGETVLSKGYDEITQVTSEGIVFKKDKKYGLMDFEGKIKIKAQYEDLKEITTGILKAKKEDDYGLVDSSGKEKLKFQYENIDYKEKAGLYIAEKSSVNSAIIDLEFNEKLSGLLSEFNEEKGYMKLKIEDEYKYYNFKFEEKNIEDVLTDNTLFVSKKDGKYGFVDKQGNVVVNYIYDEALEQNKYGYAAIKQGELWGAIDKNGTVVIEPKYELENNLVIDFIGKWHLGQDLNMNYYCEK